MLVPLTLRRSTAIKRVFARPFSVLVQNPVVASMPLPKEVSELAHSTTVPITEAKALHPAFYVDEKYTEAESDRIFGMNWFAAAHTAELANPGDVKVVDVGKSSFILTRDKKGKLNAFHNVCRHRGARICSSSQAGCKQLVCPYHWWAYRLDGTLKATPPAVTPKERKENLALKRVPGVETFAGLVFLNQNPNPAPFSDVLGDLPIKLERYDFEGMELHGVKDYTIASNWKLLAENFIDFYHVNAVHPGLSKFSKVEDHQPYQGEGQYVGFVTSPLSNSGGPGDLHNFNPFPRTSRAERQSALFFHIFPNVSITVYPHSVYTLIMLPEEGNDKTREQLTLLMAPGARKESEDQQVYWNKCQALMDFVTNINNEDVVAVENLQRGLQNARRKNVQGEFLPEYDWPIHRFQNMIVNGLDGRALEDELVTPHPPSPFEKKLQADLANGFSGRALDDGIIPHLTSSSEQEPHAQIELWKLLRM